MVVTIHPWVGMCSVIESPVDPTEEERPSGLLIQHEPEGYTVLRRGTIIEVALDSLPLSMEDVLSAGDVIYYGGGHKIGEVYIVRLGDIIAYEKSDGS